MSTPLGEGEARSTDDSGRRMRRRALRVLLAANDGASAGHVARMIAVARGLRRTGEPRGIDLELVLVTTSEAHALIEGEPLACVRLPNPKSARAGGLGDEARRRIVRASVDALAESFAPDLVVVDTFPSGPHLELEGLLRGRSKRALVRRHVRADRLADPTVLRGIERYDLVIAADDPTPYDLECPIPVRRVPPITIAEAGGSMGRRDARTRLGIPTDAFAILITSGGGGDAEAVANAETLARLVCSVDRDVVVVVARGPLARGRQRELDPRVVVASVSPMQALLAAFDGAISAAGYNTAHELAKAGVPAALYGCPRAFDDQAARATRFRDAGLACVLAGVDLESVTDVLAWLRAAKRPSLTKGGADRAAEALIDLATGVTP